MYSSCNVVYLTQTIESQSRFYCCCKLEIHTTIRYGSYRPLVHSGEAKDPRIVHSFVAKQLQQIDL